MSLTKSVKDHLFLTKINLPHTKQKIFRPLHGKIMSIISTDKIKKSFISLFERAKRYIECEGEYFE